METKNFEGKVLKQTELLSKKAQDDSVWKGSYGDGFSEIQT